MNIYTTVVAAASLGIGIMAAPAAAADRDLLAASTAPSSVASAPASADVVVANAAPNCLLPGRIRNFGGVTMLTPRRPVTLDAAACVARGGAPIESTSVAAD